MVFKTVPNLGDGQTGLEVIAQATGKKQSWQGWGKKKGNNTSFLYNTEITKFG